MIRCKIKNCKHFILCYNVRMGDEIIKNLDNLIQKSVGSNKKVVESTVKRLTAPGENYLGLVLKVEAVVKNEKDEEEKFSAVAKCVNLQLPEFIKEAIPRLYKKENGFYSEIVPVLEEFYKEIGLEGQGISDIIPKLYASRCSLDENSEEPDEDAVLLFENLEDKGYINTDRTIGFDLDGAKLILKDLAVLHAIPLALKLKKPQVFKTKIQKHMYNIFDDYNPPPEEEKMEDIWFKVLEPFEEMKPHLNKLREKLLKSQKEFMESVNLKPKEPFATIYHSDLWTNNTMQEFVDGKPIKNKFIDFQMYNHGSVAQDLIFFLWSSVQIPTLQEHFDYLIKFYHDHFIDLLDKSGCDVTQFCYENFVEEIDEKAKSEFFHVLYMQVPMYSKKHESAFEENENNSGLKEHKISEAARKRATFLISSFAKRGWF